MLSFYLIMYVVVFESDVMCSLYNHVRRRVRVSSRVFLLNFLYLFSSVSSDSVGGAVMAGPPPVGKDV